MTAFQEKYQEETVKNEDKPVTVFLADKFGKQESCSYLEVGSGMGRFPLLVRTQFSHFKITCLDINPDLVKETTKEGFKSIHGSILNHKFPPQIFDVVHCAHVIEHFGFPQVAVALDEMLRILKPDGYLIIRTPLMHSGFYINIDHVRPYPPQSILTYFGLQQQQKKSPYKITVIKKWFRREVIQIEYFSKSLFIKILNQSFLALWIKYRWFCARPNGYVLILQKKIHATDN